jgi:hypothetical protein
MWTGANCFLNSFTHTGLSNVILEIDDHLISIMV